jgi:hypothetical protein
MADGRDGVYDQTEPVTVEVLGRSYALSALVMGHTVLLGAIVLEGLDLAVDPGRQRLMPKARLEFIQGRLETLLDRLTRIGDKRLC